MFSFSFFVCLGLFCFPQFSYQALKILNLKNRRDRDILYKKEKTHSQSQLAEKYACDLTRSKRRRASKIASIALFIAITESQR